MSVDKVQLSQEEYVGGQVVKSDINPITNTPSVLDPDSGSDLRQVIDRLWTAINSQLERVVNSVNNKDGIVVITPSDIGLGNVDNVSYAEIKEWVLEQISNAFYNKRLRLFDDFADLDSNFDETDLSLAGVPFYVNNWNSQVSGHDEHRAAIGVFYILPGSDPQVIQYDYKFINVINGHDGSVEYDYGILGVKIHPNEPALQKTEQGLMIDPAYLSGNIMAINGFYEEDDQMLATGADPYEYVDVYLDGVLLGSDHRLKGEWLTNHPEFKAGVLVIMNWNDRVNVAHTGYLANTDPLLMNRQPAIGRVDRVPDETHVMYDYKYVLQLHTIRPYVGKPNESQYYPDPSRTAESGYGLGYYFDPSDTSPIKNKNLGIRLSESSDTLYDQNLNYSGLTACVRGMSNPYSDSWSSASSTAITPAGHFDIGSTGLAVQSDATICTVPYDAYRPSDQWTYIGDTPTYIGSKYVKNWSDVGFDKRELSVGASIVSGTETVDDFFRRQMRTKQKGYASTCSMLSVRLNKFQYSLNPSEPTPSQVDFGPYMFFDASGIVMESGEFENLGGEPDLARFGITDGKDAVGNEYDITQLQTKHNTDHPTKYPVESGGLRVNVGKFLEICPKATELATEYTDGGKVQVRIGNGLREEVEYISIPSETVLTDNETILHEWFLFENGEYTQVPTYIKSDVITGDEPDHWANRYLNYYVRTGDSEPYTYTKNTRSFGPGPDYAPVVPEWESGKYCVDVPNTAALNELLSDATKVVCYIIRKNRIGINIDPNTLSFNEDGQLTVSGGGGGGILRFIDSYGSFIDYNNPFITDLNPKSMEFHQRKTVNLGEGLKIVGGIMTQDQQLTATVVRNQINECITELSFVGLVKYYESLPIPTDVSGFTLNQLLAKATDIANTAGSMASVSGLRELYSQLVASTLLGEEDGIPNYNMYQYQSLQTVKDRITTISNAVNADTDHKVDLMQKFCTELQLTYDASKSIDDYIGNVKYKLFGWIINDFTMYVIDPSLLS